MNDAIRKRLREFLKSKSWTKAEFSRRMHIYPQVVNRYLYGNESVRDLIPKLLENNRRSQQEDLIRVVGEEVGSKLDKAKQLGIELWDEQEFLSMVNKKK